MTNLSQSGSYFTEPNLLDFILSQSVSQSVISRSRPALTPPPAALNPAPPLPVSVRQSRYFTVPNLLDFIPV